TGGAFERPTWWSAASRRNGAAPKCCLASARRKNASSSSLLYCGGPAPAGGVFVSASSSRDSWRTTLRPASDYSRRTSASLTCRRGRRPPHEPDHFLQTEWDLTFVKSLHVHPECDAALFPTIAADETELRSLATKLAEKLSSDVSETVLV